MNTFIHNNSRKQGDIGVTAAMHYYTKLGYCVSLPIGEGTRYDLVVDSGTELLRVQCKTTTYIKGANYVVAIATSGGNRSGTGRVKKLNQEECDLVFVWCSNDAIWEIPSAFANDKASIILHAGIIRYHVGGPEPIAQIQPQKLCGCGAEISRGGTRCRSCAQAIVQLDRQRTNWPESLELLEMIRAENYVKVGRKLGVSDNAVRKHVKALGYDPKTLTPTE